jgi:hypothetical protein
MNVENGSITELHPLITKMENFTKKAIVDVLEEGIDMMGLLTSYENMIDFEISGYIFSIFFRIIIM